MALFKKKTYAPSESAGTVWDNASNSRPGLKQVANSVYRKGVLNNKLGSAIDKVRFATSQDQIRSSGNYGRHGKTGVDRTKTPAYAAAKAQFNAKTEP